MKDNVAKSLIEMCLRQEAEIRALKSAVADLTAFSMGQDAEECLEMLEEETERHRKKLLAEIKKSAPELAALLKAGR